jgi:hypothetical protein
VPGTHLVITPDLHTVGEDGRAALLTTVAGALTSTNNTGATQ